MTFRRSMDEKLCLTVLPGIIRTLMSIFLWIPLFKPFRNFRPCHSLATRVWTSGLEIGVFCSMTLNRFALVVSSSSLTNPSMLELAQEKATVESPGPLLTLDVPDMLTEGTPSECLDFGVALSKVTHRCGTLTNPI